MQIDVTEDDIRNGRQCVSEQCPVALAVRRATGACYVSIGLKDGSLRILGLSKGIFFSVPDAVALFIMDFDYDKTRVGPFSFELDLPPKYYAKLAAA